MVVSTGLSVTTAYLRLTLEEVDQLAGMLPGLFVTILTLSSQPGGDIGLQIFPNRVTGSVVDHTFQLELDCTLILQILEITGYSSRQ